MAEIKKFQSPESSPGLQLSGEKKIWVNLTFLGAANCDSVEVVKKKCKIWGKVPRNGTKLQDSISRAGKAKIKKFQSLESSPGLQFSGKKKILVNSTLLWAANCDSVEVV